MIGVRHQPPWHYSSALAVLASLFVFRIVAQLVTLWLPVSFLPPFESWHSNVLPYPLLVLSQVLILGLMLRATVRIHTGRMSPQPETAKWFLIAGGVYGASMLARLALGLTALSESNWFSHWLPTLFHIVLASFLLVLGLFHRKGVYAPDSV